MQRVINYGSYLQAFALKKTIEGLGHNVAFLDIKPGQQLETDFDEKSKKNYLLWLTQKIDSNIFKRIGHYFFGIKTRKMFLNHFIILGLSKEPDYDAEFDAVVIGSDEVFNCTQKAKYGFTTQLFGENINANKIISYAASSGFTTIERINTYGLKDILTNALTNFSAISVRDKNTKRIIKELTGNEPEEHLDPTLIYDFSKHIPNISCNKDFILIYAYGNRISDKKEITAIRNYAKKKDKKLIGVGMYQNWCDENTLVTPFELLAYFQKADSVITDTFHGTVFSIKYNKNFCTLIRESNQEKLNDLLQRFDLENRIVNKPSELENILDSPIDYEKPNEKIKQEKEKAIQYLQSHLD